jgi:adenine-specific DNA-methyltransferase
MLNVIYFGITEAKYSDRLKIDPESISGIPKDWTRSDFNYTKSAFSAFSEMIDMTNSSHILISYNDNGMIKKEDIIEMLESKGHEVSVEEIRYKNLNSRPNKKMDDKVSEYLFYSTAKNPFKNIE